MSFAPVVDRQISKEKDTHSIQTGNSTPLVIVRREQK